MTLAAVVSARGSPGVTTASVVLASTWPHDRDVLVWETDPAGGTIAARFGLSDTPGTVTAVPASRRLWDYATLRHHTQDLPGGSGDETVAVLTGYATASQAAPLVATSDRLAAWFASHPTLDVLADCGRVGVQPAVEPILRAADLVLMCARPRLDELRLAAAHMTALTRSGIPVMWLLSQSGPYSPEEIADAFGFDVFGQLPNDSKASSVLDGSGGGGRHLRRSLLVRSARTIADDLWHVLHPDGVGDDGTGRAQGEEVNAS